MAQGEEAIEEIKIALYWQRVLGEMEYVDYDPDDLRRWYKALELRGPSEIRAYVSERTQRHNASHLHGLVAAPHPPLPIVELWLQSHENKPQLKPFWIGLGGFTMLSLILAMGFNGCQTLKNPNPMVLKPPQTQEAVQPAAPGAPPAATATAPQSLPVPASTATNSTQQGQQGH